MENTCHWETCPFRRRLKLKQAEECPNFYENIFVPTEGQKQTMRDCAPIRTMLMIQGLHGTLIGVQQSNEQQRNKVEGLLSLVEQALSDSRRRLSG